jgi:hypothetical protein
MFLICEHSQPFSLHSFLSQTPDNSLTYTHVHLFTRKHFIFLPHTHTHTICMQLSVHCLPSCFLSLSCCFVNNIPRAITSEDAIWKTQMLPKFTFFHTPWSSFSTLGFEMIFGLINGNELN